MRNIEGSIRLVCEMDKLTYYSFHIKGEETSEFDKFFKRFKHSSYQHDYENIMSTMIDMGYDTGALMKLFRNEGAAEALPPPNIPGDIRLYCNRVSPEVVLLGNGCVKISMKVQDSKDCLPHFKLMNELGKRITQRMFEGDLTIRNGKLEGNLHFKIGEND